MPQNKPKPSAIEQLAQLATDYQMSPAAELAAREAILDLVTAAAAAKPLDVIAALRNVYGNGSSTVWFSGQTAAPAAAGFANALAAAALDLDDGHRTSRGHPGAAVIPAVFAEADRLQAEAKVIEDSALLRAIAIGYEVGIRIASARGFYARTGFWAGTAAVAGAASLRNLTSTQLAHSIAIAAETGPHMATTTAPPAWPQPNGSDVKEGIPWGVSAGLTAVSLADSGFTGALDLLDHPPFFDATAILANREKPAISETYTKFYAACRHIHAPVEALVAVMEKHDLAAEDIEAIDVATYSGALRISNQIAPFNIVDAQYSIPYCLGLVACYGPDCLLPMTEDSLGDANALAIAARVTLSIDDACEQRFPKETAVRVTIKAKGNSYQSAVTTPSGDANCPPSWQKRVEKFCVATRKTLDKANSERFLEAFEALDQGQLSKLRQLLGEDHAYYQK